MEANQTLNGAPESQGLIPEFPACPIVQMEAQVVDQCRFVQLTNQKMNLFWNQQNYEINNISVFKGQNLLPLARIKRLMKANTDVKMVSSESPVIFGKACELLVMEIVLRSWLYAEEERRKTLQRYDIAAILKQEDKFEFLLDALFLRDEPLESGVRQMEEEA